MTFTIEEALISVYHTLKNFCLTKCLECTSPACAIGETSAYNAFYREVFPMAQRELRTPDALRDRGVLTDNAFYREVSSTFEEALVSVYRILKNFCLTKCLERKTPVLPLEKPQSKEYCILKISLQCSLFGSSSNSKGKLLHSRRAARQRYFRI